MKALRTPAQLSLEAQHTSLIDAPLFCSLSLLHGIAILVWPSAILIALLLWWNANTISHNFLHRGFFAKRWQRRLFAGYLSVLLGFPHQLWKERHLAHHAVRRHRLRYSRTLVLESACVILLWSSLALLFPSFLLTCFLPGFLLAQLLCALQGHFEHARGTTSHYGWLYNRLFFNDGYHIEHHAQPTAHWRRLPALRHAQDKASTWPAVLRFMDGLVLNLCEYSLFWLPFLRRFVLRSHEDAVRKLLPKLQAVRRIGIVGGGIFPRSALIFRKLLADTEIVIIDGNEQGIAMARRFVDTSVKFIPAWFDPRAHDGFDLLVVPLALQGERSDFYERPPAPLVLVHDWIWNARGDSCVVSPLLLKRLNLIERRSVPWPGIGVIQQQVNEQDCSTAI